MKKILIVVVLVIVAVFAFFRNSDPGRYTLFEFGVDQKVPSEDVVYEDWLGVLNYEERKLNNKLSLVTGGHGEEELNIDTGQCGACTKNTLELFLVDHEERVITRVIHLSSRENICEIDYEYRLEDDFKKVISYSGDYLDSLDTGAIRWSSEAFCFDENAKKYLNCGAGKTPPSDYKYASLEDGWCPEALMLLEYRKNADN